MLQHFPAATRDALAPQPARTAALQPRQPPSAPGGAVFVLARKLWIEDCARAALDAGLAQAVVLGAGYDPLAIRLAGAYPHASFWELDHPDTQDVKRRALERHHALPAALRLLPLDLAREPPDAALAAAGWAAGRPSLAVAEGVVMYLDEAQLAALMGSLARALAPRSRLVISLVDARKLKDQAGTTARTALLLKASGEPLRSWIDPAEVPAFLAARGFRCLEIAGAAALRTVRSPVARSAVPSAAARAMRSPAGSW